MDVLMADDAADILLDRCGGNAFLDEKGHLSAIQFYKVKLFIPPHHTITKTCHILLQFNPIF